MPGAGRAVFPLPLLTEQFQHGSFVFPSFSGVFISWLTDTYMARVMFMCHLIFCFTYFFAPCDNWLSRFRTICLFSRVLPIKVMVSSTKFLLGCYGEYWMITSGCKRLLVLLLRHLKRFFFFSILLSIFLIHLSSC